jgi:hypothetical protein
MGGLILPLLANYGLISNGHVVVTTAAPATTLFEKYKEVV